MKKALFAFICIVCISSGKIYSQEIVEKKNSISAGAFGTSAVFGLSYERLITDKIMAEIGFGILGYGLGVTYYPFDYRVEEFNFYTGIKYSNMSIYENLIGDQFFETKAYIPIGVTFVTEWNSLNFGVDIGPAIHGKGFLGNLKIGFRF